VEFVEARPVQGGPEKYYRATQRAILVHQAVLPDIPVGMTGLIISSIDPAVRRLADQFSRSGVPVFLIHLPLSSMDGLISLRQGLCQVSAAHLIGPESSEYNRSFVRHLFPNQPMALIQIFKRVEGLIVQPGNPLGIRSLEDLERPDARFVNREAGSGVRQWLERHLNEQGIQSGVVPDEIGIAHSHNAVARKVQQGAADFGLGLAESARTFGLDFIPQFEEPYELVMPESLIADPVFASFFEFLNSGEFRAAVRRLDGYVVPQTAAGIEIVR
jgi:putative molybdopterin biosynthesis protein